MISAVFDANVLYSFSLRGIMVRLARDELLLPFWSEEIHDEWIRNLLMRRPDLKRESLERVRQNMNAELPHSLVTGYEGIIPSLPLPDPNDRHVLAVAIHAKAPLIVTFNLNDFPESALAPYGIKAISPDELVSRLIDYDAEGLLNAVARHRAALTRPSKTVEEYLATLEKQGLTQTVAFLWEHRAEI